ncbi:hypothetical protein [Oleidesulfovibrio sp.]|uniref:hypothetical protein n=1 Tax=Oleidesulfovibrio sp. TaxID=2909707 RepID=UPI003A84F24E
MMVPLNSAVQEVLRRLKKLPDGGAVDMRTFKRDRSVMVQKCGNGTYRIVQDGFEQRTFADVPEAKLKKQLQSLLSKEFPRSNNVRLYQVDVE